MPTLGTLSSFTISASLAGSTDGEITQSAGVDLGATSADALIITMQITPSDSAGSTAGYFDYYLGMGAEGTTTALGGNLSGSQSSLYDPNDGGEYAKLNARFIGRMATSLGAGSSVGPWNMTVTVPGPIPRYVAALVENKMGTATDVSSSAADNFVKYQTVDY